jgi:protein arginine N-methyltransferase 1
MSYSVNDYAAMIGDQVRVAAYLEAMRRMITPDSVVVELGTGIGFFAVMACRFGAQRVYAIEPNDAIEVAREIAAANGCADRIEFIQDLSTNVTLPERAGVIVSDLRGVLPFWGDHFASIADARRRHLAPGGVLIPQRDTLWAAIVTAPKLYADFVEFLETRNCGLNMEAARKLVLNSWGKGRVAADQLLTEANVWTQLDYATIESPNVSAELNWNVTCAGEAHGVMVWFDAELAEGVGFSNAPGGGAAVYGSALFPFLQPVPVEVGDEVRVQLSANRVVEDYLWSWNTKIQQRQTLKAEFRQSTFFGTPLSPQQLRRRASEFSPTLNDDGRIVGFVLEHMTGAVSLGEIAEQLQAEFPARFANRQAALAKVSELSQQFSR